MRTSSAMLVLFAALTIGCGSSVQDVTPEQGAGGDDGREPHDHNTCPADVGVHHTAPYGFSVASPLDDQATVVSVFADGKGLTLTGPTGEYDFAWPGRDLSPYFEAGDQVAVFQGEYHQTWQYVAGAHTAAVHASVNFMLPSSIPNPPHGGPSLDIGTSQCSQDDGTVYHLSAQLDTDAIEVPFGATEEIGDWQVTNIIVAQWPMIMLEDGSHAEAHAPLAVAVLGPTE